MRRKRDRRRPAVGGVVNRGLGDTTKQGRRRKARRDAAEMAGLARKQLKMPTTKEVMEIERTKER